MYGRFVGSFPVDEKFQLSFVLLIFTAIKMTVMVLCGSLYSYLTYGIVWNTNAITYMGVVLLNIYTTFAVTVCHIHNRGNLKRAIDKIEMIDESLLTMGVHVKYNKTETYGEMFLRVLFKVILVVFDWVAYKESMVDLSGPLVIVSLYYSYFVIINAQQQYTTLMNVVRRHFRLVNKQFLTFTQTPEVLERFLQVHCHLCDTCDILSDWFSPQLLLICLVVFLVTTLSLSSMFMSLISFLDPYPPQILLFISCTFWVFARLFEMWEILYISSNIERDVSTSI